MNELFVYLVCSHASFKGIPVFSFVLKQGLGVRRVAIPGSLKHPAFRVDLGFSGMIFPFNIASIKQCISSNIRTKCPVPKQ